MPPRKKQTNLKTSVDPSSPSNECCVCCQDLNVAKDEALFCSGSCQQWLHRFCAGVSRAAYKVMKTKNCQFLCFACHQLSQQVELTKLRNEVNRLSTLIDSMTPTTIASSSPAAKSYASAVGECGNTGTLQTTVPTPPSYSVSSTDRKYNIVVYGVGECAPGMTRSARQEADLESVTSLFSKIDRSFTSQSVRDCFRLGKFAKDGTRPRPLLVKLIRVSDVNKIFTNARLIPKPYFLKPDMSTSQRNCESILLKERWSLIQSGILRKNIRIREDALLVNNKVYGRVADEKFQVNSEWQSDTTPVSRAPAALPTSPRQSTLSTVDNITHNDKETSPANNEVHSIPHPHSDTDCNDHTLEKSDSPVADSALSSISTSSPNNPSSLSQ